MTSSPPSISTLTAIRAAHHPEATPQYDRVVFEFSGPLPLFRIEHTPQLIEDGTGRPVQVAGRAILMVQMSPARAHDDAGQATAPRRMAVSLPNVRELASGGDFEASLTYGIGLDHRAELRILTLASPNRLVIDLLQA